MNETTLGKKWERYVKFNVEDMRSGNVPFDGSPDDMAIMVYGFLNWLAQGEPSLEIEGVEEEPEGKYDRPPLDALYSNAKDVVRKHKRVSTSLLQRELKIGYVKSALLVEELQAEGVISAPDEKTHRRHVL